MNKTAFPSEHPSTAKQLLFFVAITYLFAIAIRLIWVYQFSGIEQFYWNDQLMINTNDGYYFAEIARDLLAGIEVEWVAHNGAVAIPTVFLAKVLPFSFETIILYMPAFFGSLLVIPLILIGQSMKQPWVGFMAALLGSIAWSYYNRTMVGYYDTDMLNIVLPMMVLWSLIFSIQQQKNRYLLLVVFFIILSAWWYPKNSALNMAMIIMAMIYSVRFDRHNLFNYKLYAFAFIALAYIPVYLALMITGIMFLLFHFKQTWDKKTVFPILLLSIFLFLYSGAFNSVMSSLNLYVINRLFADELPQLLFYDVIGTVREAGAIPFETFANRISGHTISFLLATVGVIWMIIRYPIMIISLPMIFMGFMAYKAGLRFTVYAVPVYALGTGFLVVVLGEKFKQFFVDTSSEKAKYTFYLLITALLLYPNINHIYKYKVPTVFNSQEVQILDHLKSISNRDDYVLSWWDYGYPLRYYSDINTLVDGGMHTGELNFPVSYALINDQVSAANIARLDVEYAAMGKQSIKHYMQDYGFRDPNAFLSLLNERDFDLPPKNRDIYFYLPARMLDIYPTVALFGVIDLTTGKQKGRPFFYQTSRFKDSGDTLDFGNGIILNKKNSTLRMGKSDIQINTFTVVGYEGKQLVKKEQRINPSSPLSIIYLRSYNKMLIMDQQYYDSSYIQLFVLENYDPELFEPVITSPWAKVYKLKR